MFLPQVSHDSLSVLPLHLNCYAKLHIGETEMKRRIMFFVGAMAFLAIVIMVFSTRSSVRAQESATATPTITPTSTPTPLLADPPEPSKLPTDLSVDILYQEPPEDCAKVNDPEESCSTREGQSTDMDFLLSPNNALVMTGDVITISQDSKELVKRPNKKSGHDLWVVVNNTNSSISLHMKAPHGSFRGYFTTESDTWTMEQIAFLRDLHLERFLQPPQPRAYTPTPVANAAKGTNVRVAMWNGEKWLFDSGYYWLKDPYWQRAS